MLQESRGRQKKDILKALQLLLGKTFKAKSQAETAKEKGHLVQWAIQDRNQSSFNFMFAQLRQLGVVN